MVNYVKSYQVQGYGYDGEVYCSTEINGCATEEIIKKGNPIFAGNENLQDLVCYHCHETLEIW